MTIQVLADLSDTKRQLLANLQRMLKAVDAAPVTYRQKLWLGYTRWCQVLTSSDSSSREALTEGRPADPKGLQASSGGSRCTG